jgi:N-methylhydantoinase A/oxoprolinase/acetone carboxylase beta subunit
VGQGFELAVEIPEGTVTGEALDLVRDAFDEVYSKRYGFASPDKPVEATTWKLTAYGDSPSLEIPEIDSEGRPGVAVLPESRAVYFPETEGFVETPVFSRYDLTPGQLVGGPAIIEENESTTVIPPGLEGLVDRYGTVRIGVV